MIGRLNHVALAVPDLEDAARLYRETLGARVSEAKSLPAHGARVVFVELPNTRIELMEPLGEDSPIAAFLAKNPAGGMHHLCYEVEDIAPPATASRKPAHAFSETASRRPARTGGRSSFSIRRTSPGR